MVHSLIDCALFSLKFGVRERFVAVKLLLEPDLYVFGVAQECEESSRGRHIISAGEERIRPLQRFPTQDAL